MITEVFLTIIIMFLWILGRFLSFINFIIPPEIMHSITYFIGHLNYLRGFIDIDTIFKAFGVYLVFIGTLQVVKVGLWVWGHIPFIGKHAELPSVTSHADSQTIMGIRSTTRKVLIKKTQ